DGEVERIDYVRPEMRVQAFASTGRDTINARKKWLGQSWECGWNGGIQTINSDAKCRVRTHGGSGHFIANTTSGSGTTDTLHWLDQTSAEQRHQHKIHSVETSV